MHLRHLVDATSANELPNLAADSSLAGGGLAQGGSAAAELPPRLPTATESPLQEH